MKSIKYKPWDYFPSGKKGFTLIELLVVVGVAAIFGVLIVTIFTRTLRGTNKSQIIGIIKQNGQAVLEEMDKTIRSADKVICPPNHTPSKIIVVDKGGSYTRYKFIDPNLTSSPSQNGYIKRDKPIRNATVTPDQFAQDACTPGDPENEAVILTDTNRQAGVSVDNGTFARNISTIYKDQIIIAFRVKPGEGAPQSVAGQIDPVNFRTTIQLRN